MPDNNDDDDFFPWEGGREEDNGPVFAAEGEITPVAWFCASCGEANQTNLDLSGGLRQEYVEDCAVCCRPNTISITVDPETYLVALTNELEE